MQRELLLYALAVLVIITGCCEKRGAVYGPESESPDWLFGDWIDSESGQHKFSFTPEGGFAITGYGEYAELNVSGECDWWSDNVHFKLEISETNSPYMYPVGWYSGELVYSEVYPSEMTLMMNKDSSFPETPSQAEHSWKLEKMPEAGTINILPDFSLSRTDLSVVNYIVCALAKLSWEFEGDFEGYYVYRSLEGSLYWSIVSGGMLAPEVGCFEDYFWYSIEDYSYPQGYGSNYIYKIQAVTSDSMVYETRPKSTVYGYLGKYTPPPNLERVDYNTVIISWGNMEYNPPSVDHYVAGYRLYRVFDDPAYWNGWELVSEITSGGCSQYSFTDNIQWEEHSVVYYSVVWLTQCISQPWQEPVESPLCYNLAVLTR